MKVLHISDLHVTNPGDTLKDVWLGPAAAVRGQVFDFVVISGDLSQEARKDEYVALAELIRDSILPLLRVRDVWRIIVVPGNHDVDWGKEFRRWDRKLCVVQPTTIAKEWSYLTHAPELSRLRMRVERDSAEFFDIGVSDTQGVAQDYLDRFRNVQAFLDELYGAPRAGHKKCNLLSDGDDWSLHLFEEEGVAFFGLNSCSRNDQFWTGASFNRAAIVKVEEEARKLIQHLGSDALLAAVWHHGLESDKGRPDRLGLDEIANLYNAGIRVGFHGHVHQDMSRVVHLLDRSMVLVSTGSIGARAAERPDGVTNQFGVVDLNPAYVRVQRYDRNAKKVYDARTSELFHLRESPAPTIALEKSSLETQSRTWRVAADGIARIEVKLEELRNAGGLVLAAAGTPFGNVAGDQCACLDDEQIQVRARDIDDGRISFELPNDIGGSYKECKWSMTMSNVLALSQTDLTDFGLSPARRPTRFQNCPDGYDQLSTTVLLASTRLTLDLQFDDDAGTIADPRMLVEQEHDVNGSTRWTIDHNAAKRCELTTEGTRRVRVVCKYPEVGQRYSLLYRPEAVGRRIPDQAAVLSLRLLGIALRSPPRRDAYDVVGGLTRGVREAVCRFVEAKRGRRVDRDAFLGPDAHWIGLLWDRGQKLLYPAFGEFFRRDWSVSLAAGEAAPGHAFRFGRTCGWHPQSPQSRIFAPPSGRSRREGERAHENSWNLSIPILLGREEAAIGVIAIHGSVQRGYDKVVEQELELLAEHWNDRAGNSELAGELASLLGQINLGFWKSVIELERFLPPTEIEYARRIAQAFVAPAEHHETVRAAIQRLFRRRARPGPARSASAH